MKIVNKKKFVRSIIIVSAMLILTCLGFNNSYSKGKVKYKEDFIFQGDTLWSIAENQIKTNDYYRGKDIRKVVYELKELNNLQNKNLTVGQKIKIPYM